MGDPIVFLLLTRIGILHLPPVEDVQVNARKLLERCHITCKVLILIALFWSEVDYAGPARQLLIYLRMIIHRLTQAFCRMAIQGQLQPMLNLAQTELCIYPAVVQRVTQKDVQKFPGCPPGHSCSFLQYSRLPIDVLTESACVFSDKIF